MRNTRLDFNLRLKGREEFYSWHSLNIKKIDDNHKPLEIVVIVSKNTMQTKQFTYLEFKQKFEEI